MCICRCVSGKRLCSGCSQPLGKGAAMNIDTLGLFFHMQCFKVPNFTKTYLDQLESILFFENVYLYLPAHITIPFLFQCGVCNRQMGDATTGTDVRIRNGHLSCHECYIATRGENTHMRRTELILWPNYREIH